MSIPKVPISNVSLKGQAPKGVGGKGDVIGMIADIVGMVGGAVITASYQKKNAQLQQQIEENLAKLSDAQREEIKNDLQKISDSNERLSVLINYLADKLGNESALSLKNQISTNLTGAVNKQTKQIYLFVGISVALLIGIVLVKKIMK